MIYELWNNNPKKAEKFIRKLPKQEQKRILVEINKLPHCGDIKRLQGVNLYRLRVGDYRIIYDKNDIEYKILVVDAGNRGQVYKRI